MNTSIVIKDVVAAIARAFPRPFRAGDVRTLFMMVTGKELNRYTVTTYLHAIEQDGDIERVPFAGGNTRDTFYAVPAKRKTFPVHVAGKLPLFVNRDRPGDGTWGMQYSCFIDPMVLVELAGPGKYFTHAGTATINDQYRAFDAVTDPGMFMTPLASVANVMVHCFDTELDASIEGETMMINGWSGGPCPLFQVLHGWNVIEALTKQIVLSRVAITGKDEVPVPRFPVIVTVIVTASDPKSVVLLRESFAGLMEEFHGKTDATSKMKAAIETMVNLHAASKNAGLSREIDVLNQRERAVRERIKTLSRELTTIRKDRERLLGSIGSR